MTFQDFLSNHQLIIHNQYVVGDINISCVAYLKIDETFFSDNLSSNYLIKRDEKNNCIWIFDNRKHIVYKRDLMTNSILEFSDLSRFSIIHDIVDISVNGFNVVIFGKENLGIYFSNDGGLNYSTSPLFDNNDKVYGQYTTIDNNDNLWVAGGSNWQGLIYAMQSTIDNKSILIWHKCAFSDGTSTTNTEGSFTNVIHLKDNVWFAYCSSSYWAKPLISFDNGKTWENIDNYNDDININNCSTHYFDEQNNELLFSTTDNIYVFNIITKQMHVLTLGFDQSLYNPYMEIICQGSVDGSKSYLFFLTKSRQYGVSQDISIYVYDRQADKLVDIGVFNHDATINSLIFVDGKLVALTTAGLWIADLKYIENNDIDNIEWTSIEASTNFISFVSFNNNKATFIGYKNVTDDKLSLLSIEF